LGCKGEKEKREEEEEEEEEEVPIPRNWIAMALAGPRAE